jgi:hypothetical protein
MGMESSPSLIEMILTSMRVASSISNVRCSPAGPTAAPTAAPRDQNRERNMLEVPIRADINGTSLDESSPCRPDIFEYLSTGSRHPTIMPAPTILLTTG